jgi:NhaA family Na+:H+ antiporter
MATLKKTILRPFQEFAQREAAGGILLFGATVAALVWANSPVAESYAHLWHTQLAVTIGSVGLAKTLHVWVNDGLMTIFFLVVGLEIKRELVEGELRTPKRAILPIAAALGGVLAPAGLYALFNAGTAGARGWGIPMATDIAFSLGVLTLLGTRAPAALKVFLTAFAIIDDLGAVLVIALFYTSALNWNALAIAALLLGLLIALNKTGFNNGGVYAFVGFWLWLAVLQSGVHATIAGVLLAMTIPCDPDPEDNVQEGLLYRLERAIHPWVTFLILPIFALSNAGVSLGAEMLSKVTEPVSLGVTLGLVLGKPIGITLFAWLAVVAGLAALPTGVNWKQILGAGMLGGIGFTMSLFINELAFGESILNAEAKLAVLIASAIAGIAGTAFLRLLPAPKQGSGALN